MKCKSGNSLDFLVKTDNLLPKVRNKLIISDMIFNVIVRKCFGCDFVNDFVRKSFGYAVINNIVIKTSR